MVIFPFRLPSLVDSHFVLTEAGDYSNIDVAIMSKTQLTQSRLLLASSSSYRAELLGKLGLPFIQASPNINETAYDEETAYELVKRLSLAKAQALCQQYKNHIIIASDQVALCDNGEILGKPHTIENAVNQLMRLQGQRVCFLTGLCLLSKTKSVAQKKIETANVDSTIMTEELFVLGESWHSQFVYAPYVVYFKQLKKSQIQQYVALEKPLDCAGSFKSEGLGIALFDKFEGEDPNSLIGLPLIQLCNMLSYIGIDVLAKEPV